MIPLNKLKLEKLLLEVCRYFLESLGAKLNMKLLKVFSINLFQNDPVFTVDNIILI